MAIALSNVLRLGPPNGPPRRMFPSACCMHWAIAWRSDSVSPPFPPSPPFVETTGTRVPFGRWPAHALTYPCSVSASLVGLAVCFAFTQAMNAASDRADAALEDPDRWVSTNTTTAATAAAGRTVPSTSFVPEIGLGGFSRGVGNQSGFAPTP